MPNDLDSRKVVILEDDSELIDEIERRLRDHGYQSIHLRQTRDIIKFLKAEKPKTMIMDVASAGRGRHHVIAGDQGRLGS